MDLHYYYYLFIITITIYYYLLYLLLFIYYYSIYLLLLFIIIIYYTSFFRQTWNVAKKCDLADKSTKSAYFRSAGKLPSIKFRRTGGIRLIQSWTSIRDMQNVAEKCFSANVPKVVLGVGTTMLVRNYRDKREIGVVPDATSNEQPI